MLVEPEKSADRRPLRPGDVVEVRSAAEILATLDADGALDAMPFMPEMARLAGRRFTVSRRVDKICDTIAATGSRRIHETVYLDDLRCDGAAPGGCQAACRLYWKEAWLRRVEDDARRAPRAAETVAREDGAGAELERVTRRATRPAGDDVNLWRCQATAAFDASGPLKTSDLAQYWRELHNGNFGLLPFLFRAVRGFFLEVGRRTNVVKPMPLRGPGTQTGPAGLGLQPGELVRVRSAEEIAATLDETGHNRRLSFDREMLPYCGRTMRVKERVDRIIDDKTGRLLKLPTDCLILEGGVCSGDRTAGCWFCPREIYSFWREAWVERVEEPR
jgi:hypothetical protein